MHGSIPLVYEKSQGNYEKKYNEFWYDIGVDTFSEWLVKERELRGRSQNKLAGKMNLSQAAVSRVEAGLIPPTAKFCKKLAAEPYLSAADKADRGDAGCGGEAGTVDRNSLEIGISQLLTNVT